MLLNNASLDRLNRGLDASILRQNVIANNIANVDTPNFKRSEVQFEQMLQQELQSYKSTFVGRRTDSRHLHIGGSSEKPIHAQVSIDERTAMNNNNNNVDIDYEMSLLAKNQLNYNTFIQQLNHDIKMTRAAIDGRRWWVMKLTNSFDISASALTAQRLRMDVISANIANADVTRGKLVNGKWEPYQRKLVVMEPKQMDSFKNVLDNAMQSGGAEGVKVTGIIGDKSPYKQVYNPTHPDADENGYVLMPNVDVLKEMVDMISASRSYEANVTALNASKAMYMKALEIGK
jgi:flagellar basal-body rod protein FlgC